MFDIKNVLQVTSAKMKTIPLFMVLLSIVAMGLTLQSSPDKVRAKSNLPVLGSGSLSIGMLYDGKTDRPILGQNLFKRTPVIQQRDDVFSDFSNTNSIVAETKISERLAALEIDPGMALSFLGDFFPVRILYLACRQRKIVMDRTMLDVHLFECKIRCLINGR